MSRTTSGRPGPGGRCAAGAASGRTGLRGTMLRMCGKTGSPDQRHVGRQANVCMAAYPTLCPHHPTTTTQTTARMHACLHHHARLTHTPFPLPIPALLSAPRTARSCTTHRRFLYRSRKVVERRKRRLQEEQEDDVDRQQEAREFERRAKRVAAERLADGSAHEGTPGPAGSVVQDSEAVRLACAERRGLASCVAWRSVARVAWRGEWRGAGRCVVRPFGVCVCRSARCAWQGGEGPCGRGRAQSSPCHPVRQLPARAGNSPGRVLGSI